MPLDVKFQRGVVSCTSQLVIVDFPRYRGHAGASRRGPFKGLGTDTAEVTVAAGSIVKDFDVIKDVGACELARFVDPLAYAFLLQAAEEGLGDGVVPAVAAAAHAGVEADGLTDPRPVFAAVWEP